MPKRKKKKNNKNVGVDTEKAHPFAFRMWNVTGQPNKNHLTAKVWTKKFAKNTNQKQKLIVHWLHHFWRWMQRIQRTLANYVTSDIFPLQYSCVYFVFFFRFIFCHPFAQQFEMNRINCYIKWWPVIFWNLEPIEFQSNINWNIIWCYGGDQLNWMRLWPVESLGIECSIFMASQMAIKNVKNINSKWLCILSTVYSDALLIH